MRLARGDRLGPYEIEDAIGAGGMGEVYRARDTRLERTVAIKALPDAFAGRADRKTRFQREARAIAALNHPHICTLHDVGEENGVVFLVMEYVEGETLAQALERRDRGASRPTGSGTGASAAAGLPGLGRIDRVIEIATEIAGALDAAHLHGFVHRDLKPANIMLTRAGVKLLDFGLAKSADPSVSEPTRDGIAAATGAPDEVDSSKSALTEPDRIVGTLRYASPEQLQSRAVDRRSDVFSFGSVLYEMLTGHKAFEGRTDTTLIAAILENDPVPLSQWRADIPPALARLVTECLAKSPDDRWQSAGDIRRQLEALSAARELESRTTRSSSGMRWGNLGWLAFAVSLVALTASLMVRRSSPPHASRPPPAPVLLRFEIEAPGLIQPARMALSPDGERLAYIGRATPDGPSAVFLRHLGAPGIAAVAGTEKASDFFWSADGTEIAFVAALRMARVRVDGGGQRLVGKVDHRFHGGTWNRHGEIIYSDADGRLQWYSRGGAPQGRVYEDEIARFSPRFLPDGAHFLFTRVGPEAGVYIGNLRDASERRLDGVPNLPGVDPGGTLVYRVGEDLFASPFDLTTLSLRGQRYRVIDGLDFANEVDAFSISSTGILAMVSQRVRRDDFFWVDRQGQALTRVPVGLQNFSFSLSSDEKTLLVAAPIEPSGARAVHLFDGVAGRSKLLARDPDENLLDDPVWSPDGRSFAYVAHRNPSIIRRRELATGAEATIFAAGGGVALIEDWSDDGKQLVIITREGLGGYRLGMLPVAGDQPPVFHSMEDEELDEVDLSPDQKSIVYGARRQTQWEIYLRPLTGGPTIQLSRGGGVQPRFDRDGRSIYFLALDGTLMQVALPAPGGGVPALPNVLFATGISNPSARVDQYRPSADGKRFLLVRPRAEDAAGDHINIVFPWSRLPGL